MNDEFTPPSPADVTTARLSLGLTQGEAAELLGADRVSWARYEGGTRTMSAVEWRYWLHVTGIERIPFRATKVAKVVHGVATTEKTPREAANLKRR